MSLAALCSNLPNTVNHPLDLLAKPWGRNIGMGANGEHGKRAQTDTKGRMVSFYIIKFYDSQSIQFEFLTRIHRYLH